MKVILENKIISVVASSENASFPDENLIDEHPKRVWKGNSVDSAALVCSCSAGVDSIAVFNTNAESVSITVDDPNEIEWQDVTWIGADWQSFESMATTDLETQGDTKAIWGTVDLTTFASTITINLSTATGTVIEAGVVVIGYASIFKNPQYGLGQGLHDYSVSSILANGATYYNKLDLVRTFTAQILPQRDTEFYTFMNSFARTYGKEPKAWRLTDADNFEWVCYARLTEMPQGQHAYPTHSPITFNLIEVV